MTPARPVKRQIHRVKRGPRHIPPPLPKEATPIAPREYEDRFGARLVVVWNGQRGDPDLRDLAGRYELA